MSTKLTACLPHFFHSLLKSAFSESFPWTPSLKFYPDPSAPATFLLYFSLLHSSSSNTSTPWRHYSLVPDHRNKVSLDLFAGGVSCLQFVQNVTSAKHNKMKCNKMRCACTINILFVLFIVCLSLYNVNSTSAGTFFLCSLVHCCNQPGQHLAHLNTHLLNELVIVSCPFSRADIFIV